MIKRNIIRTETAKMLFDYALEALRNANVAGLYTMAQTVYLKENLDEENC